MENIKEKQRRREKRSKRKKKRKQEESSTDRVLCGAAYESRTGKLSHLLFTSPPQWDRTCMK
jgi:hypothetical protein